MATPGPGMDAVKAFFKGYTTSKTAKRKQLLDDLTRVLSSTTAGKLHLAYKTAAHLSVINVLVMQNFHRQR